MSRPPLQLTVRSTMIVVAVVALVLCLERLLFALATAIASIHDEPPIPELAVRIWIFFNLLAAFPLAPILYAWLGVARPSRRK